MGQSVKTLDRNMKVICLISVLLSFTVTVQSLPQGYAAAPPYAYTYAVNDAKAAVNFGEEKSGGGDAAKGSYYVSLPDGRLQTVRYAVDPVGGYVADVSYGGAGYSQ